MIQAKRKHVADQVLAIMEELGLTVEQLMERAAELAGRASRVRARDEALSGHEMSSSFDREKWVRLLPGEIDGREDADELDHVIALARPDLDATRRAEIFRDWSRWNIKKAEREGREAKALRLRELFGFAHTWKPCLDLWRATRRAGRNAAGAAWRAASGRSQPPAPALAPDQEELMLMCRPVEPRDLASLCDRLSSRLGSSAWRARVAEIQLRYGCTPKRASWAACGAAVLAGEVSP